MQFSLSFSVVPAKNTRAYGSIFQHFNILGSLEDRKEEEICAVEPEIDYSTVLPDTWNTGSKVVSRVSVLLCLKVFQWYLMDLKEVEIRASGNEKWYKHFYKLVVEELHILHLDINCLYVPFRYSL